MTPAAPAPLCRAGARTARLGDGLPGGRPAVARIVSARSVASDPADPFPALPLAAEQALGEAGIGADALSAVQVAGPHAAVALLVEQSLGLDPDRVQPLGGPCARGFAGPAEGLLLLVDLLDHLDLTGGRFGLIVEAGPWGMATAVVIDREQMSRLNAWMLGDEVGPSRVTRLRIAGARAGRPVRTDRRRLPPDEAFRISRRLARVLGAALDDGWTGTDRHGLMRRVWQLLGGAGRAPRPRVRRRPLLP